MGGGGGGEIPCGGTQRQPPPPDSAPTESQEEGIETGGLPAYPLLLPNMVHIFGGREMISVCPPQQCLGWGGGGGAHREEGAFGEGEACGSRAPPPHQSITLPRDSHWTDTNVGCPPPQNKTLFASTPPHPPSLLSVPQWEVGGTRRPWWDLTSPPSPPWEGVGMGVERGWGERGRAPPAPPNRCGLRVV